MRKIVKIALAGAALMSTSSLAQTPPAAPAAAPAPVPLIPSKLLEQSSEYRFQLDYQLNPAAVAKFLPAGWVQNPATTGAAKDCNVRVIFIDRVNIVGPDGRTPLGKGSARMVYLAALVKETATGNTGQMIIAGLTDNADDVPGAFGDYALATTAKMTRSVAADNGALTATEDWQFQAASGERIRMHVVFTPAPANKGGGTAQTKFYDPRDPSKFLLFQTDQVTDITRNVTTTPADRVKNFTFSAGGGKLAALFDGTEKPLSWDSQRSYSRTVSTPQ